MKARFGKLMKDLSGRSGDTFIKLLIRQVDAAVTAARLVEHVVKGEEGIASAHKRMTLIEHEGDVQREAVVAEISRALSTPLDREDLFRVSRSLDDVLDNLRDFVRELDLYRPRSTDRFSPFLHAVIEGLEALREAIAGLGNAPSQLAATLLAKKVGNKVRRAYQHSVAKLLEGEFTMETIRQRELLRRLDIVGLRVEEAADALADALVKRGP